MQVTGRVLCAELVRVTRNHKGERANRGTWKAQRGHAGRNRVIDRMQGTSPSRRVSSQQDVAKHACPMVRVAPEMERVAAELLQGDRQMRVRSQLATSAQR